MTRASTMMWALVLVGCQDGGGAGAGGLPDGEPCGSWTECAASVCVGGRCGVADGQMSPCGEVGAACNRASDCCAGIRCVSNACVANDPDDPGPPPAEDGETLPCGGSASSTGPLSVARAWAHPLQAVTSGGPCMALHDEGDDGTIDRQTLYRYDGCQLVYEEVGHVDGRPGTRIERGYDVRGNLAWAEHDMEGDGVPDVRERWSNDPDGRHETKEVDVGIDGLSGGEDMTVKYTYYLDRTLRSEERDQGADGSVDSRYAFVYLDGGATVIEDYVWLSEEDRGEIYYRNERGFDDAGRMTSLSHDMHANGVVQWRRHYRYDALGRLIEETQDTGDDGVTEFRTTYSYDCWEPPAG